MEQNKWAALKIETDALNPNDGGEIIRIVIIDNSGLIWNEYYKPEKLKEWPDTEQYNGISPEMLEDKEQITQKTKIRFEKCLSKYDFIVCSNINFIKLFLDDLGITYPKLKSTNGEFERMLTYKNIEYNKSITLENCAEFFGITTENIPEKYKSVSGCYKIWACHKNLDESFSILELLTNDEQNKYDYRCFKGDTEILEYLKRIKVAMIWEQRVHTLYYDGRFLPKETFNVFIIGLILDDNNLVDKIVCLIDNLIIGIKENEFINMQKRYKLIKQA